MFEHRRECHPVAEERGHDGSGGHVLAHAAGLRTQLAIFNYYGVRTFVYLGFEGHFYAVPANRRTRENCPRVAEVFSMS